MSNTLWTESQVRSRGGFFQPQIFRTQGTNLDTILVMLGGPRYMPSVVTPSGGGVQWERMATRRFAPNRMAEDDHQFCAEGGLSFSMDAASPS